jgi:hypothetical protein
MSTIYCGDCGDVIAKNPEARTGRLIMVPIPGTSPVITYETTVYDGPEYIHLDETPQCGSPDDAARRKDAQRRAQEQRASIPGPHIPRPPWERS